MGRLASLRVNPVLCAAIEAASSIAASVADNADAFLARSRFALAMIALTSECL